MSALPASIPTARAADVRPSAGRIDASLELATLLHFALLTVVTAWWFGGQSPGAREWLNLMGALALTLFIISLGLRTDTNPTARRQSLLLLWPLLGFDLLVLAGSLNPILRPLDRGGVPYLMLVDPAYSWLPVCARPADTLRQLWLLNGIIISAFNVFLNVRRRSRLRLLLALGVGNALILSVFGTFQRFSGAKGLYFGTVDSPQSYFFSTFVYHNHWGAYVLLAAAGCLGLIFHTARRGGHRDFWHSPVAGGVVALLVLAAAIPLSASRSSTLLLLVLLGVAVVHGLRRTIRHRRERHESVIPPALGILACALIGAGAVVYVGREVISQRARQTREQIVAMQREHRPDSRLTLYRDTLRMAADRPWTGWGLASYGDIFRIYNTQRAAEAVLGQPYYKNAHNDWLQMLSEVGIIGSVLMVLLGLLPSFSVGPSRLADSLLVRYLLFGCVLIMCYAGFEFPLASPSVLIAFWGNLYIAARYIRTEEPA